MPPMHRESRMELHQEAIIDLETLDHLKTDVSEEGLMVMLGVFCQELAERIDRLRIALNERDAMTVQNESHTLMSIAGQFGALPLRRVSEEVNSLCKQNKIAQAFENVQSLIDLGTGTVDAVNNLIEKSELS